MPSYSSAEKVFSRKRLTVGINTLFLIPGEVGGSETYFVQTLSALLGGDYSLDVVLFTQLDNDAFLRSIFSKYSEVTFCKLNFRASSRVMRILREQWELPFRAAQYPLDLLWSPGYTAPLFAGCRQVVSVLDMQYKNFSGDFSELATRVMDFLIQAISWKRSFVITISEFSKKEILKYTSILPERVFVTPLAVEDVFSQPIPVADISQEVSDVISRREPYLLCVSNTYPHKNVAALIQAFTDLPADYPHHLVLIGKPARGEEAVRKAIDKLPPGKKVFRLKGLGKKELIALYQHADLFIFPSLYEGFGLPVLEAMRAGTLVLTTRCASIPEVAEDCAVYFDPHAPEDLARQIQAALLLPTDSRSGLVERGRKRAQGFSWIQTAAKTYDCFCGVCNRGSAGRQP